MSQTWDQDEYQYCFNLVHDHGNKSVGFEPPVVASYLRLQAASAFRANDLESAACLGHAATQINWSADNHHEPRWDEALKAFRL